MENTTNIITAANLDFEVEKRPHWFERINDVGQSEFIQSDMSCGIFRTDTGAEIGDVGQSYAIAQYHDVCAPFVQAANDGYLNYKSGGALEKGRKFQLTFETGQTTIQGEDLRRRIIVGGSHDGSWSLFFKTYIYRQICTNGLMGFGMQDAFRVRHTENWRVKYNDIIGQLSQADKFFDVALNKYRQLFDVRLNLQQMRDMTRKLLDIKGEIKDESTRKQNQLLDIMSLTQRGKGIAGNNEIQGTAAAWFNAVAEYVDHYTNRQDHEKQFISAFFGAGEDRKKAAFELAYATV